MNILVTNDDGVTAPGLRALTQELCSIGKVYILAPDRNWSASGHVRTLDRPLRVREIKLTDGRRAFSCDGTPSDCVALAACGFFDAKMDLVVSGINTSANIGNDLTYSGTVMAALEAVIWGIPAVAVSLDQPDHYQGNVDYTTAAQATRKIALRILLYGLPPNTFFNINVPFLRSEEIKGLQVTRLGQRIYHNRLEQRKDPRGTPYYWVIGDQPTSIPEPGTDVGALADGYISITPVQHDMTAYRFMEDLGNDVWEGELNQDCLVTNFLPSRLHNIFTNLRPDMAEVGTPPPGSTH